ncbi:MAG: rhamnulokinase [Clostridiales bacterium]|jgi:rhamnulokinase|nr:rhamnulokinase [Clostridiales bacterium]
MEKFLAVDIGASSGRHILGRVEGGRLVLEEAHRFANTPKQTPDGLVWDTESLFSEIVAGMKKCGAAGNAPASFAVDTWGVDYVLRGADGADIQPAFAYRDPRTEPFLDTSAVAPDAELYARTGIQKQPFNTLYQLLADKAAGRLERAEDFLMLPEYFSCRLTGEAAREYTNATTTGLVNPSARDWDYGLAERFGLPRNLFKKPREPGFVLGGLSKAARGEIGFGCRAVLCASHDTASAVAAVPSAEPDFMYISSGTWSLLGTVAEKPILTPEAALGGYSNEGAAGGGVRFLKNIMGLWIVQECRREYERAGGPIGFAQIAALAEAAPAFRCLIDPGDARFYAPGGMIGKIRDYCRETGQSVPQDLGEIARCVFESLAFAYREAADDLERVTGRGYGRLYIVGGGSANDLLNRLTAGALGRPVYAGVKEATSVGNILCQAVAAGALKDMGEGRRLVGKSFEIREYEPRDGEEWGERYARYEKITAAAGK